VTTETTGTTAATSSSGGGLITDTGSPTTAPPTQGTNGVPEDIDGSQLTVITATIGQGEDRQVATLTSVVPGPVVTSDGGSDDPQVINNGAVGGSAPAAALAIGFAFALI